MRHTTQFFGAGRIIIVGRYNGRYSSQWLNPKNEHEASFSGRVSTNKQQPFACFLEHLGGFIFLLSVMFEHTTIKKVLPLLRNILSP